ncbi:methyltransferase domain-containing protein [Oceanobacillus caeni]
MKRSLDRISEAYFDELGPDIGSEVRKRIQWICENSTGENVLDVGCSQGITSILLGREAKNVLGIDIEQESIDYANDFLNNEAEITKRYVNFKVANFLDYDFQESKFDRIILGNILEYITDPMRFMSKAKNLITNNGQIIVTVPFGQSDDTNQVKGIYLSELLNWQKSGLKIQSLKFFGGWIGVIYEKSKNKGLDYKKINNNLLQSLEENFHKVDNTILGNIPKEISHNEKLVPYQSTFIQSNKNEVKELTDSVKDSEMEQMKKYKDEIKKLQLLQEDYKSKLIELENNVILEKKKKIQSDKLLLAAYKKEERLLNTHSKLLKQYEESEAKLAKVEKNYQNEKKKRVQSDKLLLESYKKEKRLLTTHSNLLKRYEALKSSKLGNLTINYWKWRRKNFGGKTSGSKIDKSTSKNS